MFDKKSVQNCKLSKNQDNNLVYIHSNLFEQSSSCEILTSSMYTGKKKSLNNLSKSLSFSSQQKDKREVRIKIFCSCNDYVQRILTIKEQQSSICNSHLEQVNCIVIS
ncbi:hypothetical protein HPP92_009373 [Vanilla planifolia]|uniref:Uncharacterized protein n=1 Tax=Vanilla planifolia TaxID=51239 RepID=A0A835RJ73_VANPL|nr:hypothetical protein HPP92_009373 [Vanilla planifolia]